MNTSSSLKFVLAVSTTVALFGAGCGASSSAPLAPSAAPTAPPSGAPTSGASEGGAVQQSATIVPSPEVPTEKK